MTLAQTIVIGVDGHEWMLVQRKRRRHGACSSDPVRWPRCLSLLKRAQCILRALSDMYRARVRRDGGTPFLNRLCIVCCHYEARIVQRAHAGHASWSVRVLRWAPACGANATGLGGCERPVAHDFGTLYGYTVVPGGCCAGRRTRCSLLVVRLAHFRGVPAP